MKTPANAVNQQVSDVLGLSMEAYLTEGQVDDIEIMLNGHPDDPMPVDIFFREPDEFSDFELLALEMSKGHVLDLGAGAGCHAKFMQDQGIKVTALEQSERACKVMRNIGITDVRHVDFFEWESEERFDTILLLMNGFGMGQRLARSARLFEKLKKHLAEGGSIIGDSTNISYMQAIWGPQNQNYVGDVTFDLKWRGHHQRFEWVYLDEEMIQQKGNPAGLKTKVLSRGESHNFLVRLSAV